MLDPRLDKSMPPGVDGISAWALGWADKENGELLRLAAEAKFDAVVTLDKRMRHEQNERALPLPVIILNPVGQHLKDHAALIKTHVANLLERNLENRFYPVGPGVSRKP